MGDVDETVRGVRLETPKRAEENRRKLANFGADAESFARFILE